MIEERISKPTSPVFVEIVDTTDNEWWRLSSGGDDVFRAHLEESSFAAMIASGQVRLKPKDLLEVEMEKHQLIKDGRNILGAHTLITKVIRYLPY